MATATFGARSVKLAAIRQERGVSLEQIAESTKISIRFLRAIEAEKFEELPGGIFRISYLKQYAKCVECDEGELLARFSDKMRSKETVEAPPPTDGRRLFHWFRRL